MKTDLASAPAPLDVLVIGAGPVGLCFAAALAAQGYTVTVLERSPLETIADPAFDGREIALTHRSMRIMQFLGLSSRIAENAFSPIKRATVMNGGSRHSLLFDHQRTGCDALGYLVSNCCIRKAAYLAAKDAGVTLLTDRRIASLAVSADEAGVRTEQGEFFRSRLVVAADGRFSETRRAVGIPADMLDFGKSMLVCRMQHEVAHQMTAWEWFHEDWTLALLPLQDAESSVVVTLPDAEARRLERAPEPAFNDEMETRFQRRLGRMKLTSSRHVYPLVASFARRFCAPRCALIGDAAVGMHPVTAHGFNLGLRSQEILVDEIRRASAFGIDWASDHVLRSYERAHRRASLGLYLATNAIVRLYTDPHPVARACRSVGLRLADRVRPFKRSVLNALTDAGRH